MPRYPQVKVALSKENGNSFVILALCSRAAKKAGLTPAQVHEFESEAMSGNYDHLLQTAMNFFAIT